jgi:hypothetical protein
MGRQATWKVSIRNARDNNWRAEPVSPQGFLRAAFSFRRIEVHKIED